MTAKLDHALALAAEGFKVFPLKGGSKAPPLLHDWPNKATSDVEEVKLFWTAMPDANIGIHCAGMIVVDVDVHKGGDASLAALEAIYDLPDTRVCCTPSGGRHLYYLVDVDVPNGVDRLGAGIDIRGHSGYVVAPGSTVGAGDYLWADPNTPVARAPQWLIDKLGTIVPKASTNEPIPDAPDPVLARAKDWLSKREPAVQGSGGDLHTVKTALWLRDNGCSEAQALELMAGDWNAACSPPWEHADLSAKVASAYRSAQNEPGAKAALPSDFPVYTSPAPVEKVSKSRQVMRLSDFAEQGGEGSDYVVKGLLQRSSAAVGYGAPGEGKTFVFLDLAYHVAAGAPWHGLKVHAGGVLYLAFEGTGGLVKRAKALRQRYGTADVPLYVSGAAMNIREAAGRAELGSLMATLPAKPSLIVFDTFARALCGGDENSAQDVGAFNSAIAALVENTGACVLLIHHSGKNKAAGARGSSALLGAIDTELEVDGGQVAARKQRDVEMGAPIGFKLVPVVVGIDSDGDPLTSCVVEPAQSRAADFAKLTGNAKRGFDALQALSPNNAPVTNDAWKTACTEFAGNRKATFWDLKQRLLDSGHVVEHSDGTLTRRLV